MSKVHPYFFSENTNYTEITRRAKMSYNLL